MSRRRSFRSPTTAWSADLYQALPEVRLTTPVHTRQSTRERPKRGSPGRRPPSYYSPRLMAWTTSALRPGLPTPPVHDSHSIFLQQHRGRQKQATKECTNFVLGALWITTSSDLPYRFPGHLLMIVTKAAGAGFLALVSLPRSSPCSNAPELSNNIIQKGLAFARDWSGTVLTRGTEGAQRSCPAGSMADAGLRWCGATPLSTERRISMSKAAKKSSSASTVPVTAESPRCRLLTIPRAGKPIRAPSNLASSRCCNHPQEQRLPR